MYPESLHGRTPGTAAQYFPQDCLAGRRYRIRSPNLTTAFLSKDIRMLMRHAEIGLLRGFAGFTLVEMIAALAILAILASLSIPGVVGLDKRASRSALETALAELNQREQLSWSKIKLTDAGWVGDAIVFANVDKDLGDNYRWSPSAKIEGGTLHFENQMVKLKRTPSLTTAPGQWEIIFWAD